MKNTILALLCFASFAATAQKISASKVPSAVKAAFIKVFPDVKNEKWEAEDGGYEAAFKKDGHDMTASFDAAGAMKEIETAIPVSALPAAATQYIREHYQGEKVREAAELRMPDGTTNYEAEVKGTDVIFDGNGTFLKTAKEH